MLGEQTGSEQLSIICLRKIDMCQIFGVGKPGRELFCHLGSYLKTARTDGRSHSCVDSRRIRPVSFLHAHHGLASDLSDRSPPACVHSGNHGTSGIRQQERDAISRADADSLAGCRRDERISFSDATSLFLRGEHDIGMDLLHLGVIARPAFRKTCSETVPDPGDSI